MAKNILMISLNPLAVSAANALKKSKKVKQPKYSKGTFYRVRIVNIKQIIPTIRLTRRG